MKQVKEKAPTDMETLENNSIATVSERQAVVKQTADIDGFLEKRKEFIEKVSAICVEGKDYHIIKDKKSLAKGGAEKIASIFQWNAIFEKDTDSLEMLGVGPGLVCLKCVLSKGTKFVGEGRGAASLKGNGGDPNKTLKMAQKSAFIDAVLRASGLSDFFTQDLEDMNVQDIGQPHRTVASNAQTTNFPPSEKQIETIKKNMDNKGVTEADLIDNGFPPLKDLTGGQGGTASEVIDYLFKYKAGANYRGQAGLNFVTPEDKVVTMLIKDLEKCSTVAEYDQVSSDIRMAKEMGKIDEIGYSELVKVAKVIVQKIKSVNEVRENGSMETDHLYK